MKSVENQVLERALAAPFDPSEVKWKPQSTTRDGTRALAVPYIDARAVMDRLDEVCGLQNWQDTYEVQPHGGVVCNLTIRIFGEWVSKQDSGSPSEQPDEGDRFKAAFSDGLKRAAVKFGIGRYLYRLPRIWANFDPKTKQFTDRDELVLPPSARPVTREQIKVLVALYEELHYTKDDLTKDYSVVSSKDLTEEEAESLIDSLKSKRSRQVAAAKPQEAKASVSRNDE